MDLLHEFWHNFSHNLFKPLLLFFYLGFSIPLLRVSFEFPYVLYQGLTTYLLLSIGWHGGEELAQLSAGSLRAAVGLMLLGFCTNFCIGMLAYFGLRKLVRLRKIDAATVAGYYGSDSAGTFVTCVGVLSAANLAFAPFMPVVLAVMEIPGCLVALYLVSRLRQTGIDARGYALDEVGYDPDALPLETAGDEHGHAAAGHAAARTASARATRAAARPEPSYAGAGSRWQSGGGESDFDRYHEEEEPADANGDQHAPAHRHERPHDAESTAREDEAKMALEKIEGQSEEVDGVARRQPILTPALLHEVFLNPGIVLLVGGILIGFVSRLQGEQVTGPDDSLFVTLFQGMLCLFLLEMGITASKRLKDLRQAGWKFIVFGLLAPNLFATIGILLVHAYNVLMGADFAVGTYVLFAVLCGSASYIAVPAVQRLAIPEASPTLPLAASLGLTFSYNVTIGIPLYLVIAKAVMQTLA